MLSNDQLRILEAVLDTIIPPSEQAGEGRSMPGAGQLGLSDFIAAGLERSPELEPVIASGLSTLGPDFAGGPQGERASALSDVAASQPGFLPILLFQTYQGYYQNPQILEALGLPPRPPHPKGYEVEPSDLTLLDPVRARGKIYRE